MENEICNIDDMTQEKCSGLDMDKASYWNQIAVAWKCEGYQKLWRCHSDAVNDALLLRWQSNRPVDRLLKTDVFDEAFGNGLYTLLASRANTVVAMDLSLAALKSAKSRHSGLRVAAADALNLPFADETFDVVFSDSTLDHFESTAEITASLRELHRVQRTGGHLLLTLDNPANPVVALRNRLPFGLMNRLGIVPYYVGTTLGQRHLRRMLRSIGFEVIDSMAVMHCPRVLAVAVAGILQKYGNVGVQKRFLGLLAACEHLSKWPTRYLTGHYIAVKAEKIKKPKPV